MSTAVVRQPVSRSSPVSGWSFKIVELWHLTSLDAPSVAVVWLLLLNREVPRNVMAVEAAALAIAVWAIYILDRLLDAKCNKTTLQHRHRFHARHERLLLGMLASLAPVLLWLVLALPSSVRLTWMAMGLPLAAYATCVHFLRVRIPKEFVVGLFFSAVISAPSMAYEGGTTRCVLPALLLFVLCWWNCLLITLWEARRVASAAGDEVTQASVLVCVVPFLLVAVSLLCALLPRTRVPGAAGLMSGAFLLFLHRSRNRLAPLVLRSLADAALLTPLAVLPLLHRS